MKGMDAGNGGRQPNLFAIRARPATYARIQCAGCRTTATVIARRWPPALASGWLACGSTDDGELVVWCGPCAREGRHLARMLKTTEAPGTADVGHDSTLDTGSSEDE